MQQQGGLGEYFVRCVNDDCSGIGVFAIGKPRAEACTGLHDHQATIIY